MTLHESCNSRLRPQSRGPRKWKRRRPLDRCIVGLCCGRTGLVIGPDGSRHFEPEAQEYDRRRTAGLNKYDLEAMRISNPDRDRNFPGVRGPIDLKAKERISMQAPPPCR